MRRISGFAIVCTLFAFAGCGSLKGNGLGTPADDPGQTVYTAVPLNLVNAMCAKIAQCDGAISSGCESGIQTETNVAPALGLGAVSVQTMLGEYTTGSIQENVASANQCLSDLEALDCTNAAVIGAYSSAAPTDYSHVVGLIPATAGSCPGVF